MAKKKAMLVGGFGMIGRHIIQALEKEGDWEIVGLARRPPSFRTKAKAISVDLLNRADAEEKLSGLTDVTHIFFAGLSGGVAAENTEDNLALVSNSIGVVAPIAKNLKRVVLTQGGKFYGVHLGPHRSPSKETDPRHLPPNFYYDQQDFIANLQKGKSWDFACVRPEAVIGFATGIPLNCASHIAHYATVCREMGVPLNFPGSEASFKAYNRFTDARVLGRFQAFVATNPKCGNQAFNLTNDSGFRWSTVWPFFADYFKVPMGVILPFDVKMMMKESAHIWPRVIKKYGLKVDEFSASDWTFANWFFARWWDTILEDTKRIQYGFYEVIDTEQSFKDAFDTMRKEKVIP